MTYFSTSFFVTSCQNIRAKSCDFVQGEIYFRRDQFAPPATHTTVTHCWTQPGLLQRSSLASTSFGRGHTAFSSITSSPRLDAWRRGRPAGTERQVTERHPQSRTLELRWLLRNTTKAEMWPLTHAGVTRASRLSGTRRTVCNYRTVARSGHRPLWAQQ